MQEHENAEMRECENARVRECENARMRECENASISHGGGPPSGLSPKFVIVFKLDAFMFLFVGQR